MLDKSSIFNKQKHQHLEKTKRAVYFSQGIENFRGNLTSWLLAFFFNSILQLNTDDGCKDIKIKIYVYQPFSWDHKTHIYKHVAHSSSVVKIYCPKKYQIERFLLPVLIFNLAHNRKAKNFLSFSFSELWYFVL